jgi:hypothetical protein
MGKNTKPLHHKDWYTKKAGVPTAPGMDDQYVDSSLKLYKLMFFGIGSKGKFDQNPLEEDYQPSPYVHIIEEKLTKDGQVCIVQDPGNDKVVQIYVKNPAGITDIFYLVVKNGKHAIEFIWPN